MENFIFYFIFSATKPCSFSYLRVDWRALCNKLLDKFSKLSKYEHFKFIVNIFSLLISTYAIFKSSLTHFRYDQITRTLKKMNRNIIRTEDLNDLESDFVVCFDRLFYPLAAKICTTYTWEILDTATRILSLHTIIVHQNGMDHRALK